VWKYAKALICGLIWSFGAVLRISDLNYAVMPLAYAESVLTGFPACVTVCNLRGLAKDAISLSRHPEYIWTICLAHPYLECFYLF
jgi:hypothetical protein